MYYCQGNLALVDLNLQYQADNCSLKRLSFFRRLFNEFRYLQITVLAVRGVIQIFIKSFIKSIFGRLAIF